MPCRDAVFRKSSVGRDCTSLTWELVLQWPTSSSPVLSSTSCYVWSLMYIRAHVALCCQFCVVLGCRWWPLSHITTAVAVVGRAGVSGAGSHKPRKKSSETKEQTMPRLVTWRECAPAARACVRVGWWSSSPATIGWLVCESGTFRGFVQP